jgi:hypothetical protein
MNRLFLSTLDELLKRHLNVKQTVAYYFYQRAACDSESE